MKLRSHCKINLFLHVLFKRKDGFHELESLFYFPEIYDEIEITEGGSSERLEISGPFADKLKDDVNSNLILKTYSLLKILYGPKLGDVRFKLTKNLPIAAGIGGGSSNAAVVLKALNETYELGLSDSQLYKIGARLGADVPACILDRPCFAKGVGEILQEVEMPKLNILLVNPLIPVNTAEIFKMGFEKFSASVKKDMSFKTTQSLVDLLDITHNDLEASAKQLCPQINDILQSIGAQSGCLLTRMSGSGATCFGIFETKDKALEAKDKIIKTNPALWAAVG